MHILTYSLHHCADCRKWLTEEEKRVAIERLREDQTGIKNTEVKMYQIKEALVDYKTWLLFLLGVSTMIVNAYIGNFGSLIVQGFGYSTLHTLLLQIPFGMFILFSNISAMYVQSWIPGQCRCFVACAYVVPALGGAIDMYAAPRSAQVALLVCYYVSVLRILSPGEYLTMLEILEIY